MTLLQALVLAIVQGLTELFPVSSLGHAVLLPALLHWNLDERSELFLPFLTMLHFGTLVALFCFFWRDWLAIFTGAFGLYGPARREEAIRILVLLVVATIPLVIFGAAFEHKLKIIFGTPAAVAIFLILNGVILLVTEWMRSYKGRMPQRAIADMSAKDALVIGLWQCLALFPGISRSGSTINAGLVCGLNHGTAARFSLLMAQPAVLAATVHEAWQLRHMSVSPEMIRISVIAAVVSGITALISTAVLLRYFRNHERWALSPFAFYCMGAGVVSLIALVLF